LYRYFISLNIPNAKVYAIDVSEKALATAKKKCGKPSGCYLY
jgi:methylase of polypeptide subunit release factors